LSGLSAASLSHPFPSQGSAVQRRKAQRKSNFPERILKGLRGAGLPFVRQMPSLPDEELEKAMVENNQPEESKLSDLPSEDLEVD